MFDLQLDRFESNEDESCGDVSSDEYENELVEVDDISRSPLSLVLAPGFSFFSNVTFKPCCRMFPDGGMTELHSPLCCPTYAICNGKQVTIHSLKNLALVSLQPVACAFC